MSRRQLYYTRLGIALLGFALVVIGVVINPTSGTLSTILVIVGVLLLVGSYVVNRVTRLARLFGVDVRPPA